ncbi:UNVERIFIED_ORG: hypothetical protein QFZ59_001819 [Bacillus sp. B2I3]|nr:hypothetical protein [Bacillus sp. B2I3]
MDSKMQEKCGVFNQPKAAEITYYGLLHRGQGSVRMWLVKAIIQDSQGNGISYPSIFTGHP